MKLNKKIPMGILTAVAVVSPIVTIVSCGATTTTQKSLNSKQPKPIIEPPITKHKRRFLKTSKPTENKNVIKISKLSYYDQFKKKFNDSFDPSLIKASNIYKYSNDFDPSYKAPTNVIHTKFDDFVKANRKIKSNEYIDAPEGFYAFDSYYSGRIDESSGVIDNKKDGALQFPKGENNKMAKALTLKKGNPYKQPAMQVGNNDSLIFILNPKSGSGLTTKNFHNYLTFGDTSYTLEPRSLWMLEKYNKAVVSHMKDHQLYPQRWFSGGYIPFIGNSNKGELIHYLGSQLIHTTAPIRPGDIPKTSTWQNGHYAPFLEKVNDFIYAAARKYNVSYAGKTQYVQDNSITYELIGPNAFEIKFSDKFWATYAELNVVGPNFYSKNYLDVDKMEIQRQNTHTTPRIGLGGIREWQNWYRPGSWDNVMTHIDDVPPMIY